MSGDSERRSGNRIPIQMWVEESSPDGMYFQRAANLSEGGIFLEKTIPHPVGTRVTLQFSIPDEGPPIRVNGEIVNPKAEDGALGMGLKFVDLPADVAERIRKFVSSRAK